jgi:hypothetical protein
MAYAITEWSLEAVQKNLKIKSLYYIFDDEIKLHMRCPMKKN